MPGPAYATIAQLLASIPAGALVVSPRSLDLVDVPSSTFRLRNHGLGTGDTFTFEARGAGASLAAPLSQVKPYTAVRLSGDLFQALDAGAPVVLTGPPTGLMAVVLDLDSIIAMNLEWWSRQADQCLTAHKTPLVQWPGHLTGWVCWLSAYDLMIGRGLLNPEYKASADTFKARSDYAKLELDRFRVGIPLAGAVDQTPSIADNAASSWSDTRSPDWNGASLIP